MQNLACSLTDLLLQHVVHEGGVVCGDECVSQAVTTGWLFPHLGSFWILSTDGDRPRVASGGSAGPDLL